MKQGFYIIKENTRIADSIWKMVLAGDGTAVTAPGQFVDIKLDGRFLRRPISVHDADEGSITIIYKVLGHGTEDMTRYEPGKQLDVIAGLGNGFDSCRWGRFCRRQRLCNGRPARFRNLRLFLCLRAPAHAESAR